MVSTDYIKPQNAWNLLAEAKRQNNPVYIYGMSLYGKTELIRQFFKNKTYLYFSSDIDSKNIQPLNEKFARKTPLPVVFDDLQFVTDIEKQNMILRIADRNDVQPIFISRAPILGWLMPKYTRQNTTFISERDLSLTNEQIQRYLSDKGIHATMDQIEQHNEIVQGNAYAVKLIAGRLQTDPDRYALHSYLYEIITHNTLHHVMRQWPEELKNFAIVMSIPDSFSLELAEYLTENPFSSALIERLLSIDNFMEKDGGEYTFRFVVRNSFRYQAQISFGSEKFRQIAFRAAQWYEGHSELEKAMALYQKTGNRNHIKRVLIQNSMQNPGNGHYFGLAHYYFNLSEEEIEQDIFLMSGMSMMCSLSVKQEQSEYWYEKLKSRMQTLKGTEKSEAERQLAYLDIALPHRGNKDFLAIIKNMENSLVARDMELPEFSVTNNQPSIINGGKDFCEWTLHDREIASKYGDLISLAMGKHGRPLVNLVLAESLFEKADDYVETLSLLSRGQLETELNEDLEMGFVATGLLVRFYLALGQTGTALLQYASFEKRCAEKNCTKLLPNMRALHCQIDLYLGDHTAVDVWLKKYAPDENKEIFTLFRFQYMTKIQCYISEGKNSLAFALNEKMKWYAEQYHRVYIGLQCAIFSAILAYRRADDSWKTILCDVLKKSEAYHFVTIFSGEGAVLLPLLQKLKGKIADSAGIDDAYFTKVFEHTERMTSLYPKYCLPKVTTRTDFSKSARTILRFQTQGFSVTEIAERLAMKTETVRYHIKQNYKKLGVSSKSEAIIAARELYLI